MVSCFSKGLSLQGLLVLTIDQDRRLLCGCSCGRRLQLLSQSQVSHVLCLKAGVNIMCSLEQQAQACCSSFVELLFETSAARET
jgi:hypothetical protein